MAEGDETALGAAAYGAGDVGLRGGGGAAGYDEAVERGQIGCKAVDLCLYGVDLILGNASRCEVCLLYTYDAADE